MHHDSATPKSNRTQSSHTRIDVVVHSRLLPLHPFRTLRHQPPNLPLLQATINLIHNMIMSISIPINTKLIYTLRNLSLLQLLCLLHRINIQARANMPRDVAMERPDAWIIGLVLQDNEAWFGEGDGLSEDLYVAALGVLLMGYRAVPETGAFGEDVEVVAVEMHGVGGEWEEVVNDQADGRVGAEIVDVPLGVEGEGEVAL